MESAIPRGGFELVGQRYPESTAERTPPYRDVRLPRRTVRPSAEESLELARECFEMVCRALSDRLNVWKPSLLVPLQFRAGNHVNDTLDVTPPDLARLALEVACSPADPLPMLVLEARTSASIPPPIEEYSRPLEWPIGWNLPGRVVTSFRVWAPRGLTDEKAGEFQRMVSVEVYPHS